MSDGDGALNEVEMLAGMISMAKGTRAFYDALIEEGFDAADAMKLSCAWVAGSIGGHKS